MAHPSVRHLIISLALLLPLLAMPLQLAAVEAPRYALPTVPAEPLGERSVGQAWDLGPVVPIGEDLLRYGRWEELEQGSGWEWRLELAAPEVASLRLRLHWSGAGELGVSTADGWQEELVRPGERWTGLLGGARVVLRWRLAADSVADGLPGSGLRLESVALHQRELPQLAPTREFSCHLDARCYPEWSAQAATAPLLLFERGGRSVVCTGAAVQGVSTEGPLLLTANHCISSDASAESLAVLWFFRTAACNGAPPPRSVATQTLGGRLLATETVVEGPDISLLALDEPLPVGVNPLRWSATRPGLARRTYGLHHPAGTYQRYTEFEVLGRDASYTLPGGIQTQRQFMALRCLAGRVESGSSGSPLLDQNGALVGILSAGAGDCTAMTAYYGQVSSALDYLGPYLEPATATPTPTPSATPQAPPRTVLGGYLDTRVRAGQGAPVRLVVWLPGLAAGEGLSWGLRGSSARLDLVRQDDLWSWQAALEPFALAQPLALPVEVYGTSGQQALWPYLRVGE